MYLVEQSDQKTLVYDKFKKDNLVSNFLSYFNCRNRKVPDIYLRGLVTLWKRASGLMSDLDMHAQVTSITVLPTDHRASCGWTIHISWMRKSVSSLGHSSQAFGI